MTALSEGGMQAEGRWKQYSAGAGRAVSGRGWRHPAKKRSLPNPPLAGVTVASWPASCTACPHLTKVQRTVITQAHWSGYASTAMTSVRHCRSSGNSHTPSMTRRWIVCGTSCCLSLMALKSGNQVSRMIPGGRWPQGVPVVSGCSCAVPDRTNVSPWTWPD